jgi:hypothetical protein
VNTSLTKLNLSDCVFHTDEGDAMALAYVGTLVARNMRFSRLFLFDARWKLLSLMCADECGVVWPYLLGNNFNHAYDDVETIRVEFERFGVTRHLCRLSFDDETVNYTCVCKTRRLFFLFDIFMYRPAMTLNQHRSRSTANMCLHANNTLSIALVSTLTLIKLMLRRQ